MIIFIIKIYITFSDIFICFSFSSSLLLLLLLLFFFSVISCIKHYWNQNWFISEICVFPISVWHGILFALKGLWKCMHRWYASPGCFNSFLFFLIGFFVSWLQIWEIKSKNYPLRYYDRKEDGQRGVFFLKFSLCY